MVRERIEELRRQLELHNFKYYVENAPEISDFEFDAMMRELQELERAHPEFADPNSPTFLIICYLRLQSACKIENSIFPIVLEK